jgi:tetratricopeptide (TPR) repeat protein
VAPSKKKHAREVRRDKFREKAFEQFDRVGDRLEGRGRTILYALAGLVALALLAGVYSWWNGRKAEEATRALSRVIEIADATVSASPAPASPAAPGLTFASEKERAQRVVEEAQKVENKYGDPYKSLARYFRAANLLTVDREKGLGELQALAGGGDAEVATRAKFALAQAREADGQYDAAATLYTELARAQNNAAVPVDTANLRLASVYEKQGKRGEAADILFQIAKTAREAKGKDGKPVPQSAAAREAAQKLERLDPARHAQLPAEPTPERNLPF